MTFDVQDVRTEILNPKQGGDITYMDMVDEKEPLGESQVQKMFAGSSVFITGGTGFLGKLMVEKLLRSCPDVKKLYLLARPKKNKDTAKRIQEQFDDPLYDKLRKERPNFIQKISVVEGDVGHVGLGMSEQDRIKVMNEVEFIFHGAATVRFDEALKTAVEINVRGTREMLLLARGCGKLKAMVHVSTAYSNCSLNTIEEKFYDSVMAGDKLIDLVETMDEKIVNNITPGLLGDYPNTYAYTKSVAEDIVVKYSKGLPVAVFRPSIIIATVKEPVSGWIDNVYGPTGVVVGAAVGLLHVLHCNPKAVADLVPGDMVVNACIATAWKTAKEYPGNHEDAPPQDLPPPVYNFVSSEQNPLTWEKFMSYTENYGLTVPPMQALYYYLLCLTPSRFLYSLYCFLLHWLPAYIIDGICILIGKKPMLRKAYTKISKFSDVLAYFACKQWKFFNVNTQHLFSELCDADKHLFDFDLSKIDWNEYFYSYVRGIRVFLLKDPLDTVPKSIIKYNRLRNLVVENRRLQAVTPCSIGLILLADVNNTSNEADFEVEVSPDECCVEVGDDEDCNIIEIDGDCVETIPRGTMKTFKLVAPLIDPFERTGYCIFYLDSKPNNRQRGTMRDSIKIPFDTHFKNKKQPMEIPDNVTACRRIDEDPLNDCQPVDCETYYNGKRSHFDKLTKRCVSIPTCLPKSYEEEIPEVIYDPKRNRCLVGNSLTKNDLDLIKELTHGKDRKAKDILILKNINRETPSPLTKLFDMKDIQMTVLNATKGLPPKATVYSKDVMLKLDEAKLKKLKEKSVSFLMAKYFIANRGTVVMFLVIIFVQCCLICTIFYCMGRNCTGCQKKKLIRKFFNYRQDASVTTPLICTSNIDTETTEFQYLSESSNIDKKIKCYKACQKERKNNVKMSMSDDILSKCLTRRDWSSKPIKSEAIPEITLTDNRRDTIETVNESLYQSNLTNHSRKASNVKVNFEKETRSKKDKRREKLVKTIVRKIKAEKDYEDDLNCELSEKEIKCHSYNNEGHSKVTGFKPSSHKKLGFFKTDKSKKSNVSMSTEKGAQVEFSNDSIDDFLSERGLIFLAGEDLSKYSYSSQSNDAKSSSLSSGVSSKTSKNHNVVKNVLSLLHKQSKHGPSSDPGAKKASKMDIELIHMSRGSVYSSNNESDYLKGLKVTKDSRSSL